MSGDLLVTKVVIYDDLGNKIELNFENGIPDDPNLNLGGNYEYTEVNKLYTEPALLVTLKPGDIKTLYLLLPAQEYKHGQTIEIKLHTANGYEYPVLTTIP